MIDARNTLRKVNTTINDFSVGQLRNFSAIMAAWRGDARAIASARQAHRNATIEQAHHRRELSNLFSTYHDKFTHSSVGEPLHDLMDDWLSLTEHFPDDRYQDIEGLFSPEQNEVKKFAKLGLDIEQHHRKIVQRDLEKEFKDEENPFRLAFVCAMWITGFDAPCVSTIYLDKPIKGHTLMQTIARANRVYDDEKENGLIVDYGNVYKQLEKAYSVYGKGGRGKESGREGESENPVEKLQEMAVEFEAAIAVVTEFLQEVQFEVATRDVFRKYKALLSGGAGQTLHPSIQRHLGNLRSAKPEDPVCGYLRCDAASAAGSQYERQAGE